MLGPNSPDPRELIKDSRRKETIIISQADQIADLHKQVKQAESGNPNRSKLTRTEKVALVVATVHDNPNASDRELAKLMNIPPSTFRAWPEYKHAREASMGDAPARGFKKTGKRVETTRERLPARGRRARARED